MKRLFVFGFSLLSWPLFAQNIITNKEFGYFDLKKIENNHFHQQLTLSASFDELGWNGEWFKIKKNFFSLNFSASCKRLLPNISAIWTPNTLRNINVLPQNGLMLSFAARWFFNQRRFSYAGAKITTGYLWVKDMNVVESISFSSTSDQRFHVFNVDNLRVGIDLLAGRKFVNKFISDITIEAGYRFDQSEIIYQYISSSVPSDEISHEFGWKGFYHFQIRLGFDIFSK